MVQLDDERSDGMHPGVARGEYVVLGALDVELQAVDPVDGVVAAEAVDADTATSAITSPPDQDRSTVGRGTRRDHDRDRRTAGPSKSIKRRDHGDTRHRSDVALQEFDVPSIRFDGDHPRGRVPRGEPQRRVSTLAPASMMQEGHSPNGSS